MQNADTHPWGTILGYSFLFYEAQQSGVLPAWNRAKRGASGGWRDNAHTTDGSDIGIDASGGYYDAGGARWLGMTLPHPCMCASEPAATLPVG